jgi:hypothetical protein
MAPHRTAKEQDDIGLGRFGNGLITGIKQDLGHETGIVLVHLAAIGSKIEISHHFLYNLSLYPSLSSILYLSLLTPCPLGYILLKRRSDGS